MKRILRFAFAALAALILFAGCALAPIPSPPAVTVRPSAIVSPSLTPAASIVSPVPSYTPAPELAAVYYYDINKNGLIGVVNNKGETVLPFEFSHVSVLGNDAAAFFFATPPQVNDDIGSGYGYIYGLNGKLLSDMKYRWAYYLSEELIRYTDLGGKNGAMTYAGAEIVPCRYDNIWMCGEYIVAVTYGKERNSAAKIDVYGRDGVLQTSGKLNLFRSMGDLIMVADSAGDSYGLVNAQLNEVVPAKCSSIDVVSGGLYIICRGGKYGVIDATGKEIIPFDYSLVENCCGGGIKTPMFSASNENGAYVFDSSGKQLLFLEGYASVSYYGDVAIAKDRAGKDNCLKDGKDVIPAHDSILWSRKAQVMICDVDGELVCYTKDGNMLPLPSARLINVVSPDRFIFGQKGAGRYGMCSRDGEIIVPAEYNSLNTDHNGEPGFIYFAKTENGKRTTGVMDPENGSVMFGGFKTVFNAGGGLFRAWSDDCNGLIDINGNWVWRSDFED